MAVKHKAKPGIVAGTHVHQEIERSQRENKSQRLARELKYMGGQEIRSPNPHQEKLEAAAKHIEWLELLVSGLTYAEKRTIVKLTRRVGTLERMVKNRDEKLKGFDGWYKAEKIAWKEETAKLKREHKRELKRARKISDIDRHKIEAEFIKNLQTSVEIKRKIRDAEWRARSQTRAQQHAMVTYGRTTY